MAGRDLAWFFEVYVRQAELPRLTNDQAAALRLAEDLRTHLGPELAPNKALTFEQTQTRAFEETLWRTIASLAEGEYRHKETADRVLINAGRTGGSAARAANVQAGKRRLDRQHDRALPRRQSQVVARSDPAYQDHRRSRVLLDAGPFHGGMRRTQFAHRPG